MLLLALITGGSFTIGLVHWTEERHFDRLDEVSQERLDLYVSTLDAALDRFDYLPYVLSRVRAVQTLLTQPDNPGMIDLVNQTLEAWMKQSSASALFVMNASGVVLASSNWRDEQSFVGRDYHFRPYFKDAMAGGQGRFFAIGFTTKQPGFFLSYPIELESGIGGVAVVKVDLAGLERDWAAGGENIVVTDSDGVVFLSSNPRWKYRGIHPLSEETLKRFSESRKYAGEKVTALSRQGPQSLGKDRYKLTIGSAAADGPRDYYLRSRELDSNGWVMHYLTGLAELEPLRRDARLMGIQAIILIGLLGALFVEIRHSRNERERTQREAMDQLEARVQERTRELDESNQRLREENAERTKAEAELRHAQEELIQAAKLAALGEMSAGIVHEINQPLSAMQTFLASTRLLLERDRTDEVKENLDDIDDMVKRMTTIVSHLKGFASKSKGTLKPVALQTVVDNALLLMKPRLRKGSVDVDWQRPADPMMVSGDEIRLEQILINLIRNAADAMQGEAVEDRRLRIAIEPAIGEESERVSITVSDNGPGIPPATLPKIFDPFFSTKQVGEGMGLGLSVSYGIAREMGGDLSASNLPDGGAQFKLTLNAAEPDQTGAS